MLREVGIASVLVAMIAAGICLVLGVEPGLMARVTTAAALGPVAYGAVVQLMIIRDLPRRGPLLEQPVVSPYARNQWRVYAQSIARLPEVERRRLVPVHSSSFNQARGYDLTTSQGSMRLVPVAAVRELDGVDERDLTEFIERAGVIGHVRSAWLGHRFPSGRRCDATYHSQLADILARAGAIAGRKKGAAGVLVLEPGEIAERLGLRLEPVEPACPVVPVVSPTG